MGVNQNGPVASNMENQYLWRGRILAIIGAIGWPPVSLFLAVHDAIYYGLFELLRPQLLAEKFEIIVITRLTCIAMCHAAVLPALSEHSNIVHAVMTVAGTVLVWSTWAGACRYYACANHRSTLAWTIAGFVFVWWAALVMALTNRNNLSLPRILPPTPGPGGARRTGGVCMIVPTRVPQEATVMAQWSRWFSLLIVLLFLTACTSESALNPVDTAVPQAAEPPAELSDAEPECGRLCTTGFWLVANESEVQAELDGGADPNGVGMLGQTPLGYAVSNNAAPPLVRMLLDAGARVDTVRPTSKRTPLHEAAQHSSHTEVIDLLLSEGADINALGVGSGSALHYSALNSNPAIGEVLLGKGLDVNSRDAYNNTPLLWAATYNPHPAIGEMLLDRGGEVNARGLLDVTALHLTVKWAYPERWDNSDNMEFKLKAQAIKGRRSLGSDPVAFAGLLLDRGARVNTQIPNGATPLLYSVLYYHESTDLIELLVDRGADTEPVMKLGATDMTVCEMVARKPSIQPAVKRRPDLFRRLC